MLHQTLGEHLAVEFLEDILVFYVLEDDHLVKIGWVMGMRVGMLG